MGWAGYHCGAACPGDVWATTPLASSCAMHAPSAPRVDHRLCFQLYPPLVVGFQREGTDPALTAIRRPLPAAQCPGSGADWQQRRQPEGLVVAQAPHLRTTLSTVPRHGTLASPWRRSLLGTQSEVNECKGNGVPGRGSLGREGKGGAHSSPGQTRARHGVHESYLGGRQASRGGRSTGRSTRTEGRRGPSSD
jgi:hypothetical protein